MQLDYYPRTQAFTLKVPRGPEVRNLMSEHGLDLSASASTPSEAVLFTREPYAAVAFYKHATPTAQEQLAAIQREIAASWAKESQGHIKVPPDETLAPFQIAGVEYALRRNNTLFGDVPGLGKSPQAIAFCNEIDAKRILCICPANIRLQWVKVFRRWTTMEWPYTVYPILSGSRGVHPTANFTVVSYDLAASKAIGRALAKGKYDVIIIDEGHYCKTIDTKRTRAIFGGGVNPDFEHLSGRAGAILSLTGTPLPNRPREAYVLARGMCFDSIDFMSEDRFRERFNPSQRIEREDPATGRKKIYIDERSGRHGELQARLRANFMVRREKYGPNGVGSQLGMLNLPRFDVVHVDTDRAISRALSAEAMLDIDPENMEGADAAVLGHVAVVRHMMGLAIAPHTVDYVKMLLDGGEEKVLVFAHHVDVLDIICKGLAKYGVTRIDGRLTPGQKQRAVDKFGSDKTIRVCAGNTLSMGTGTDGLQKVCNRAVFGEADWTHGVNQQAVDRLDRPGQMGQVQADFLVAPGSFSERILAASLRKLQVTNKALDRRI